MSVARVIYCILATLVGGQASAGDERPGVAALGIEPRFDKPPLTAAPESAAPGAPAPDNAAIDNPLAAIELHRLAATRERPLFSATRRPPPPPTAAIPEMAPEPAMAKPSEPAPPPFVLIGTVIGPRSQIAVLLNRATNGVTRLRVGDTESGWSLQKVERRFANVSSGGRTTRLELVRDEIPQGAPAVAASKTRSDDD